MPASGVDSRPGHHDTVRASTLWVGHRARAVPGSQTFRNSHLHFRFLQLQFLHVQFLYGQLDDAR